MVSVACHTVHVFSTSKEEHIKMALYYVTAFLQEKMTSSKFYFYYSLKEQLRQRRSYSKTNQLKQYLLLLHRQSFLSLCLICRGFFRFFLLNRLMGIEVLKIGAFLQILAKNTSIYFTKFLKKLIVLFDCCLLYVPILVVRCKALKKF